jgi:hypothetical protein
MASVGSSSVRMPRSSKSITARSGTFTKGRDIAAPLSCKLAQPN